MLFFFFFFFRVFSLCRPSQCYIFYVCVLFNKSYKLYPALCIKQSKDTLLNGSFDSLMIANSVAHWGCQQHLWVWLLLLCETVVVWHVKPPLLFHLFFRHAQEIVRFFFLSHTLLLDFYSIKFYSSLSIATWTKIIVHLIWTIFL